MTPVATRGQAGRPWDPPSSGPAPVLELTSVSKRFRSGKRVVPALEGVSLRIGGGLVTGLIGPDGAGKTTLLRVAVGLLGPDAGGVMVLGLDVLRDPLSVQAAIGYMPQQFGLYEDLTVQENLDLYADLQGVLEAQRPARYQELMRMTGLAPFTGRLAGRLSGGMKQKLGLACTLVRPPRLLLLDEPTVGVDPLSRRELWAIVYRLVREEGMTVLVSTAYLDEAERCDEVILLHEGRVLGHGPPRTFSEEEEGRTFAVTAPGLTKREVQARLANRQDVLDAVIQGERVRLVMRNAERPALERLLPDVGGASLEAVPPRFEDRFVALLHAQRSEQAEGSRAGGAQPGTHEPGAVREGEVIQVHELERRFGDFYAVRNLSFGVRPGEIFGLLGANGAGKSTTFKMLCGLLPPTGGTLSVAGVDLRRAAAMARARLGYMSQKFSLYGNLTVRQNLDFFACAYGLAGRRRAGRTAWALEQFHLSPLADSTSGDLSLGYKQRLALACALMHEPRILFLDEPTSGVDPLARREFWHRINTLAQGGVTVLVTTHFMEEAEYCDRVVIMADGQLLTQGTPAEIKAGARSREQPDPTMEEAFIRLIEARRRSGGTS